MRIIINFIIAFMKVVYLSLAVCLLFAALLIATNQQEEEEIVFEEEILEA